MKKFTKQKVARVAESSGTTIILGDHEVLMLVRGILDDVDTSEVNRLQQIDELLTEAGHP